MTTYDPQETERALTLQGAELASFSRRAVAFFLDLAVASVLFVLIASVVVRFLVSRGWMKPDEEIVFALGLNWYSTVWTVIYFGLATYFGNGRTPGKWTLGIRTASLIHARISLWHSIERGLGYGASLLEFGFGFFQYFIHPNKRTVHDRIAETIVIRDPKGKREPSVR